MEELVIQSHFQKPSVLTADLLPSCEHPNYRLWYNYARYSVNRGKMVTSILQNFMELHHSKILDVGCGMGGTATVLADHGAEVTAVDPDLKKIQYLRSLVLTKQISINVFAGKIEELKFAQNHFNAIILQDVLEHTFNPVGIIAKLYSLLKSGGVIYIATPNRWSPLNIVSDPHWNLPFVAVLTRKWVRLIVGRVLKRTDIKRTDIAELVSFSELTHILNKIGLEYKFLNNQVLDYMIKDPVCVLNSPLHLKIWNAIDKLGWLKMLSQIVNNNAGVFNRILNPTWFLIAQKNERTTC